jgi:WD40 repeat protein
MNSGGTSEDDTEVVFHMKESRMDDIMLPVLPSSIAECCERMEDDDSVWSRSTRVASMSWDWDEPPLNHPYSPSPISSRYRGRAESYCSSTGQPPFCRPTSLSFTAGESARPEYSSPHSPGFVFREDVEGSELEGLLDGSMESNGASNTRHTDQAILARRQRGGFPFPQRGAGSAETQKEIIRPMDLADGEYDYQGIPWPRFSISRTDYRSKRVREYSNYNNVNWTAQLEIRRRLELSRISKVRSDFFYFYESYKTVNPTIDHFQLRHLLWSTNNVASYLVSNSALYEFNKRTRSSRRILACSPQQLASCHVDHGLAVTGSFDSEIKVVRLGDPAGVTHFVTKVSNEPNSITNHVVVVKDSTIIVANNDSNVSEVSLEDGGRIVAKHKWNTAVNHVSIAPNGSLLCLSGDRCEIGLMDKRSGEIAYNLEGHLDFSFCSSWRGDWTVSTGSQDGTCRVWDIRSNRTSVSCLGSLLGAVRSCKFSPNGHYLAISEPADFVHIYDVNSGLREVQLLDFFGNIGGVSFSPDSSKLSVSLADTMFGCLVDFQVTSLPFNTAKN